MKKIKVIEELQDSNKEILFYIIQKYKKNGWLTYEELVYDINSNIYKQKMTKKVNKFEVFEIYLLKEKNNLLYYCQEIRLGFIWAQENRDPCEILNKIYPNIENILSSIKKLEDILGNFKNE